MCAVCVNSIFWNAKIKDTKLKIISKKKKWKKYFCAQTIITHSYYHIEQNWNSEDMQINNAIDWNEWAVWKPCPVCPARLLVMRNDTFCAGSRNKTQTICAEFKLSVQPTVSPLETHSHHMNFTPARVNNICKSPMSSRLAATQSETNRKKRTTNNFRSLIAAHHALKMLRKQIQTSKLSFYF